MISRLQAAGAALLMLLFLGSMPASVTAQYSESNDAASLNQSSFAPIEFPNPDVFRASDGRPGTEYWQNEADYVIDVTLDPETNRVSGRETITYTNNSPHDLTHLWVHLEQNLFDPDSRGARLTPPDARFSGAFENGGYELSNIQVNRGSDSRDATYRVDGTRMRISLDEPLEANGGTLKLSMDFSFIQPKYGADRHGRLDVEKGTVYEFAQWYPRMAVYDDVNGWNTLPYLGQGEFYLEYGDFDVSITVPHDYVVTASGELQNAEDVLTSTQRDRLDEARSSDETVHIITESEAGSDATRPDGSGEMTWQYRAENVRDVAWAASDAFIWDAARAKTGDGDILAMSLYPREGIGTEGNPGWERSTEYVKHSIEHYSEKWESYPYPVAINVAGIVGGMEYPQIMFCSVDARGRGLFGVTDHEFGHTWFPMIVGSDERRHVWMDEGINSFLNVYSTIEFYDSDIQTQMQRLTRVFTASMKGIGGQQPSATHADHMRRNALGFLAYRKPATGLLLLREWIIGPDAFDAAFKTYIDRWAYKHPQPSDFFRTLENETGVDLDYFVRSWFYETDVLDFGVTDVTVQSNDETFVRVENSGELMMPMPVQVTFEDGTTEDHRIPAEAFVTGDVHTIAVDSTSPVTKVVIDAQQILPDIDHSNNTWTASDASSTSQSSGSDS
ncbi:peptidase [Longibacter salinarum]|uniref:Peptidase n=1 Tax=Longibacter salinarum TaxID=1850348 RepID=A0A2A8D115_9BACT|nr:M1 family metallopeptidase [Longibacter salinarum]PEN14652.1 peptidase [Longibacter salinarum]